ncbi:MI domain-containing protein [Aphelenchoides besseyi]|nr:MI domain-containing protein [Aphelenchoides besseyi]KAI6172789.1 MI domain-containing protein [Aphelenchoides besseyi]
MSAEVEQSGAEKRRLRSTTPDVAAGDVAKRARSRSPVEVPKADDWVEKTTQEPTADQPTEQAKSFNLLTRSGGAYIPPAKLRMMQQQLSTDKNSDAYQRMNWELLKKHIHGQVNKVNVENIVEIVRVLLQKNMIRGRGLLVSSILKAQTFSPSFSHVYAALVSIINSKFPEVGNLILKRLVIQFKRAFRTCNKALCVTVCKFLAHLANQRVAHEVIILEILFLLMDKPTDDSIELTITLLKESGEMLSKVVPKGLHSVFERLRAILEDADTIDTRTQYMIEIAMHVRKEKFRAYPSVIEPLDLIEEEDQISHMIELISEDGKPLDPEIQLNYYKYDKDFEKNEEEYEEIRKQIIGDADDSEDENGSEAGAEEETAVEEAPQTQKIIDMTEQDMVAFRRNVYLAIQSSLDFQEAAHKLIKFHYKPGLDNELCSMIVDCCSQNRTYERFYGLLAERFCRLRLEFQQAFEQVARDTYTTAHRLGIKNIRIMAQFIGHLLATDAIEWAVFDNVRITEADTTSAGRVYLKFLFQELSESLGVTTLFKKLHDPTLMHHFEGLFPKDHPENTKFAIQFFTLSGVGGITGLLREDYSKMLKKAAKKKEEEVESSSSSSSSSSDSSSDSDDSSSSSSTSSSDSEADRRKKKRSKKPVEQVDDKEKVRADIERLDVENRTRRREDDRRDSGRNDVEDRRKRREKIIGAERDRLGLEAEGEKNGRGDRRSERRRSRDQEDRRRRDDSRDRRSDRRRRESPVRERRRRRSSSSSPEVRSRRNKRDRDVEIKREPSDSN